uniref:MIF4G domain-containing protein n=1 Tax=Caenorhabditis tropicalis TaxID=1561998 RepID=A0A1I7UX58_9PELO
MSYYLSGLLNAKQIRNPPVDYEIGKEVLPKVEPQNICTRVFEILESVPRVPQEELIQEFVYLDITHNDKILSEVVDIILEKGVRNPENSQKCVEIVKAKVNHDTRNGCGKFHTAILRRNQKVFYDEREKKHRFGIANFMGEMYLNELASAKIIKRYTVTLFESLFEGNIDLDAIDHGFHLLKVTGKALDSDPSPDTINEWVEKFGTVQGSPKVAAMVQKFVELRARGWEEAV